ncbi:MAG: ribokinase [Phycisphaeraceae bacterium]|nr:ribokinase [Phycisphaeraceae bacterium]MBX3410665.1 ribokinase [Phycisphaeraceae bacterium]
MSAPLEPGRVCVVGSLNMDLVVRTAKLPRPGETVLGGSYRTYPGGKGANQAVAAARLGARVAIIGCIGDDPHGHKVRAALVEENIDLTHLITREGEATGLGLIAVAEGGGNMIVVAPGANATLKPADLEPAMTAITAADTLVLQMEVPIATNVAAAEAARRAGVAVLLNAAPARVLPVELLRNVDVLIVNRVEAAMLMGMPEDVDPGRLTLRLPTLGVPTVLLTLGAQGGILSHKGRPRRVPTPHVAAVDTVGAGDAFCGALASRWKRVHEATKARHPDEFTLVEQATLLASAAGALATTRSGAIASLPRSDETIALASTLKIGS